MVFNINYDQTIAQQMCDVIEQRMEKKDVEQNDVSLDDYSLVCKENDLTFGNRFGDRLKITNFFLLDKSGKINPRASCFYLIENPTTTDIYWLEENIPDLRYSVDERGLSFSLESKLKKTSSIVAVYDQRRKAIRDSHKKRPGPTWDSMLLNLFPDGCARCIGINKIKKVFFLRHKRNHPYTAELEFSLSGEISDLAQLLKSQVPFSNKNSGDKNNVDFKVSLILDRKFKKIKGE
jgi:hypothetical protein